VRRAAREGATRLVVFQAKMTAMKSWFVRAAGIGALGLFVASCGGTMPAAKGSGGAAAPDFTLSTLDGKQVRLSDYKGSVVLIDFWSTTCDPCMTEMPHLVDMYKKNKERGFVVLAVSADGPESRAQVSSVARAKEMIFPVLLDEETVVTARYNPKRELPFAVVVGKDGSIVHKRGGYTAGDEKTLETEVEKALSN
jgi:peroxiredoxin